MDNSGDACFYFTVIVVTGILCLTIEGIVQSIFCSKTTNQEESENASTDE